MTVLKSTLVAGTLIAALSGGALVATATTASADVACNGAGECWHVRDRLTYPVGVGVRLHDNRWGYAHRGGDFRWRHDRFDRGYYRNGVWITF